MTTVKKTPGRPPLPIRKAISLFRTDEGYFQTETLFIQGNRVIKRETGHDPDLKAVGLHLFKILAGKMMLEAGDDYNGGVKHAQT